MFLRDRLTDMENWLVVAGGWGDGVGGVGRDGLGSWGQWLQTIYT